MAENLYSIKEISNLSGVNPITLRAWERRHSLFKPKRIANNRRLFTEDDLVRIKEILYWLNKGVSIGNVKQYLQHKKRPLHQLDLPDYLFYQKGTIEGVKKFNQTILNQYMDELFSLYPLDIIAENIYPLVLNALGEHWKTSSTAFSEKQFFEFYLRNELAKKFLQSIPIKNGKKLIISTIDSAFNEVELLFLSVALSLYGFEIILLKSQQNLKEIEEIITIAQIDGLIFSIHEKHFELLDHFSKKINLPICIRTHAPILVESNDSDQIHFLPISYKLLLEKINEVFGQPLIR